MRPVATWKRLVAITVCFSLLASAVDLFGLRRPRVAFAVEERPTDLSELGIAPIHSHGAGGVAPPGNLPLGFNDFHTFHQGLVAKTEGSFTITYQDLLIPGRGPSLEIHRTYNSHIKRKSSFGRGWNWSYGVRLTRDDDSGQPVVIDEQNLRVHFRSLGGEYVSINSAQRERLTYGSGGAVRSFADGTKQFFTPQGRLLALEDAAGRRLELRYQGSEMVEAVDSVGRALRFSYADGRIVKITDPLGRDWRYEYDKSLLRAAVDPLGRRTEYSYLPKFGWGERMSHVRFPNKVEMTVYYDVLSKRVIRLRGPGPTSTRFSYQVNSYDHSMQEWTSHPGGGRSRDRFQADQLKVREDGGEEAKVLYLAKDQIGATRYLKNSLSHRDPEGGRKTIESDDSTIVARDELEGQVTIQKDPEGRVSQVVDQAGRETRLSWDEGSGQVSRLELPGGGAMSFGYGGGEVRSLTDPLGRTTRIEPLAPSTGSSSRGYAISDSLGNQTVIELDRYGYPSVIRDAAGGERRLTYDIVGRLISRTDALGNSWRYVYDAADNLLEAKAPTGGVTRATYDSMNHPLTATDGLGRVTRFGYDERGLLTEATFPGGQVTRYEYDGAGNLVAVHQKRGGREVVSRFGYDRNDRLVKTEDGLGRARKSTYDPRGLVSSCQSPGGKLLNFNRDELGRVVETTYPDSRSIRVSYAPGGRPQSTVFLGPGGAPSRLTYTYDLAGAITSIDGQGGPLARFSYDAGGRNTRIEAAGSAIGLEYDRLGEISAIQGGPAGHPWEVRYQFDAAGQLTALLEPGGGRRSYAYDLAGRLAAIEVDGLGRMEIGRDAAGSPTSLRLPGGAGAEYRYDRTGRLASIAYHDSSGAPGSSFTYSYDDLGQMESVAEAGGATRYSYDDAGRLTAAVREGGLSEPFAYDADDNLVRSAAYKDGELKYDAGNKLVQVLGVEWRYDERGNLKERSDGTRYSYDELGRLARIDFPDRTYAAYTYDPLGRRVEKDSNGATTRYAYNGPHLIAEFDGKDQLRARYIYGPGLDQPLAMWRDGKWYYFVRDRIGSVRALLDGAGKAVETYRYSAYGVPLVEAGSPAAARPVPGVSSLHPFGFTGREYDPESGLYFFRARYYDPQVGRFIQPDPLGVSAGANFYAYANADPVGIRDPFGLEGEETEGGGEIEWGGKWEKLEWISHGAGGGGIWVAEKVHHLGVERAARAFEWAVERYSRSLSVLGLPKVAMRPGTTAFAESQLWNRQAQIAARYAQRLNMAEADVLARVGFKVVFEGLAYLAFFYSAWQFYQNPTKGGAIDLGVTAGIMLLFFGLEFGLGAVLIAAGPALALLAGFLIGYLIAELLEYLGITNADPTFVQPEPPEPSLGALAAPPLFLGTGGLASAGAGRGPPGAGRARLYDKAGHLLPEIEPGGKAGPEALARASSAALALLPGGKELRKVVVDLEPPVVELGPSPAAPPGRIALALKVREPSLEEVLLRAAHQSSPSAWTGLLRLRSPLAEGPLILDTDRFPLGGKYLIEAVARDLAGNETTARTELDLPEPSKRPLQVYDLSAQVKAEVLEEPEPAKAETDDSGEPAAAETVAAQPGALPGAVPDVRPAWFSGELPAGAQPLGDWSWSTEIAYGSRRSHGGSSPGGASLHYFIRSKEPLALEAQDNLIQYVYLDPAAPTREILLQLYREGEEGEHRVYWGEDLIDLGGQPGSPSLFRAGPLPSSGKWVRLRVPLSSFGLKEGSVTGLLFGHFDGRVLWGPTTRSASHLDHEPDALALADPVKAVDNLPYDVEASMGFRLSGNAQTRAWVEDGKGEKVAQLLEGFLPAGPHSLSWDGRRPDGLLAADGAYSLVVEAREPAVREGGGPASARSTVPFELSTLVARILLPSEGALVQGSVPFFGTACGRNFDRYTLEIGPGAEPREWKSLGGWNVPQVLSEPPLSLDSRRTIHGNLGTYDLVSHSAAYDFNWVQSSLSGLATLRLRVFDKQGRSAEDRVRVRAGAVASNGGRMAVGSSDRRATLQVGGFSLRHPFQVFDISPAAPALAEPLAAAAARQGAKLLGPVYEARPAGFQFERPARVEMALPEGMDAAGAEAARAALHAYEAAGGGWRRLPAREVLAAEGGSPARITASVGELPSGRALFALLSDGATSPPLLLEPVVEARTTTLFASAEPGAEVSLFRVPPAGAAGGDPGNRLRTARADGAGLAVLPGVYLEDGANGFVARARDGAGNEAVSAEPLTINFDPSREKAEAALRNLSLEQAGDEVIVRAEPAAPAAPPGGAAQALRGTVLLRSESDGKGFRLLLEPPAGSSALSARAALRKASDPGLPAIAVTRHGERVEAVLSDGTAASLVFKDATPPGAPRIASTSHPARPARAVSSGAKQEAEGQGGGKRLLDQPVDLRQFPILSFRYRIAQDATLHLVVKVNGVWYGFRLAGDPMNGWSAAGKEHFEASRGFDLQADGGWHQANLNLYDPIRQRDIASHSYRAEEAILGVWEDTGYKELSAPSPDEGEPEFQIESAAFRAAAGGRQVSLAWEDPEDLSGISDYSFVADKTPDTTPPEKERGKVNQVSLTMAAGQDTYYFHLRARDGAGNWGATAHFPLTADGLGPEASSPSPRPDSRTGLLEVGLRLSDGPEGSGVNPDTIRLSVAGATYDTTNPALSYDPGAQKLTFNPSRAVPLIAAWPDGTRVEVELLAAEDYAKNPLQKGLQWQFVVDYGSLGAGEARILTREGGIEPAWSPDGRSIAYVVEGTGRSLHVIDAETTQSRPVPVEIAGVATPAWSPDGSTLAVSGLAAGGLHDVFLVAVGGGPARNITRGAGDHADPVWLPGGRIGFTRSGRLWSAKSDGSDVSLLYDDHEGAQALRPQLAPDGKSVLFTRSLYDVTVWLLDLQAKTARPITLGGHEVDPGWGPKAGELVYASGESGSRLLTATLGGKTGRPLAPAGGWWDRYPRVSPDGARLVYQSTRNGFWNLWLVEWLKLGELRVEPDRFDRAVADAPPPLFHVSYDLGGFQSGRVRVLDQEGREVWAPPEPGELKGRGSLEWKGLGREGNPLPDGEYLVQLSARPPGTGEPVEKGAAVVFRTAKAGKAALAAPAEPGLRAWLWGGLALAAAAAGIVLFLLFRRRSRKEA